jgi:hypothetical protein
MRTASRFCPTSFLRYAGFRHRVSGVTLSWTALALTERNLRDRERQEDGAHCYEPEHRWFLRDALRGSGAPTVLKVVDPIPGGEELIGCLPAVVSQLLFLGVGEVEVDHAGAAGVDL